MPQSARRPQRPRMILPWRRPRFWEGPRREFSMPRQATTRGSVIVEPRTRDDRPEEPVVEETTHTAKLTILCYIISYHIISYDII